MDECRETKHDRNYNYKVYESKDLYACEECGGQLRQYSNSEVACSRCGLVHIEAGIALYGDKWYDGNGNVLQNERGYYELLKYYYDKGKLAKETYELLKSKIKPENSKIRSKKVHDWEARKAKQMERFRFWLSMQNGDNEAKQIALGFFEQIQFKHFDIGKGERKKFTLNPNRYWSLEDYFERIYYYAQNYDKPVKGRDKLLKILKQCAIYKLSLIQPYITRKDALAKDVELAKSRTVSA